MSLNRKLTAQSHDPNVVRNVERQIIREAKNEETAIKHALKDLTKTEKEEGKAYKVLLMRPICRFTLFLISTRSTL